MKIVQYLKGAFVEFKDNVTWHSWSSLQVDTITVAISAFILAIFLYVVDTAFGEALSWVYSALR